MENTRESDRFNENCPATPKCWEGLCVCRGLPNITGIPDHVPTVVVDATVDDHGWVRVHGVKSLTMNGRPIKDATLWVKPAGCGSAVEDATLSTSRLDVPEDEGS